MDVKNFETPLISIVTAVLNGVRYIEEAIESVLNQNYSRFEHIIVDGGSTDGTLDVVSKYPHLQVISEPDRGPYDASNKGIRLAKGDFIGLLSSDDLYPEGVFRDLAIKVSETPSVEIITGDNSMFEDEEGARRILRTDTFYTCEELRQGKLGWRVRLNGCFLRRELFDEIGLFNIDAKYGGSRELLIQISMYRPVCVSLGRVSYLFRIHENSATWGKHVDEAVKRQDHRTLARRYISMPSSPPQIRRYCRDLHWSASVAAFRAFVKGRGSLAELRAVSLDRVFAEELPKRAFLRGPAWIAAMSIRTAHYVIRQRKRWPGSGKREAP